MVKTKRAQVLNYRTPNVSQFPDCDSECLELARLWTKIKFSPVKENQKAYRAYLQIGVQTFEITPGCVENKTQAEWYCLMMAKALKTLGNTQAAFAKGVVFACARLIEMFDQPSMAIEILNESGVDTGEMKRCAEYDLKRLRRSVDRNGGQPQPRHKIPKGTE
jgi:hypothetical protein